MSIIDEIKAVIKADDDAIENGGDVFPLEPILAKKKVTYDKFCDAKIPVITNGREYGLAPMSIEYFRTNFYEKYPVLKNLDFSNVLIAGGIFSGIKYNYYYTDVDLFIYGLDEEGSKRKLREIYENVRNQLQRKRIRVYVSKMSFTMLISYQCKIQIILRRFRSIAHVLNSFDLGSSAIGYDGQNILVSALGKFAWQNSVNVINPRMFSPGYVTRLIKYLKRSFAIVLQDVDNEKITDSVKIANYKILVKKDERNASLYTAIQTIRLPADDDKHIVHEYDDYENDDNKDDDNKNVNKANFDGLSYYRKTGKVFPVITSYGDYDDLFEHKILPIETIKSRYKRELFGTMYVNWVSANSRTISKLFPDIKSNVFLINVLSLETKEERVAYIEDMINKEIEKLTPIFDVNLPKPEFVYLEKNTAITTTPKTIEELFGILKIWKNKKTRFKKIWKKNEIYFFFILFLLKKNELFYY